MAKILLTDKISSRAEEILKKSGLNVISLPTMPREQLVNCIDNYFAIAIRSATRLDAKLLRSPRNLKLIVRGGVGVDNIDIPAATQAGIAVANTPGANTIATVELTFALMLSMARNLIPAHNSILRGEWERAAYRGVELYAKTLGVIGFGRIGKEVARRAQAFGMNVLAYDPFLPSEVFVDAGVEQMPREAILQNADYLTLHLPLDAATRHIINESAFLQMKKGVRIINCARGGLIDESAAVQALNNGAIAGLALDVYETEPPGADHPLVGHPKVIHVPHLGAYSVEAQEKVADEVAAVIIDFFLNQKYDALLNRKDLAI
ncbi:MAG: hydroxyacid dehydrogenase [bacterium]